MSIQLIKISPHTSNPTASDIHKSIDREIRIMTELYGWVTLQVTKASPILESPDVLSIEGLLHPQRTACPAVCTYDSRGMGGGLIVYKSTSP